MDFNNPSFGLGGLTPTGYEPSVDPMTGEENRFADGGDVGRVYDNPGRLTQGLPATVNTTQYPTDISGYVDYLNNKFNTVNSYSHSAIPWASVGGSSSSGGGGTSGTGGVLDTVVPTVITGLENTRSTSNPSAREIANATTQTFFPNVTVPSENTIRSGSITAEELANNPDAVSGNTGGQLTSAELDALIGPAGPSLDQAVGGYNMYQDPNSINTGNNWFGTQDLNWTPSTWDQAKAVGSGAVAGLGSLVKDIGNVTNFPLSALMSTIKTAIKKEPLTLSNVWNRMWTNPLTEAGKAYDKSLVGNTPMTANMPQWQTDNMFAGAPVGDTSLSEYNPTRTEYTPPDAPDLRAQVTGPINLGNDNAYQFYSNGLGLQGGEPLSAYMGPMDAGSAATSGYAGTPTNFSYGYDSGNAGMFSGNDYQNASYGLNGWGNPWYAGYGPDASAVVGQPGAQTWNAAEGGQVPGFAYGGGIGSMPEYAAGGKLLRGPGDGMSDSIPAVIKGQQPQRAALADGEFVIPADVVSHLGNGSTEAGSRKLYEMMDKIRTARTGRKEQGKKINPDKFIPV